MIQRLGLQYDATGSKTLVQNAFANAPANTADTILVAAVAGKRIAVLAIFAHLQDVDPTSVTLNSKGASTGTAICSTKQVAGNGGWVQARGCSTDFLFKTKLGEGLSVTTSTGSTVGLDVVYALVND